MIPPKEPASKAVLGSCGLLIAFRFIHADKNSTACPPPPRENFFGTWDTHVKITLGG